MLPKRPDSIAIAKHETHGPLCSLEVVAAAAAAALVVMVVVEEERGLGYRV